MSSVRLDAFRGTPGFPSVRNVPTTAATIIDMESKEMQHLKGDHRWRMIICREGTVWITQEHDVRDYVLTPGDVFLVTQSGRVLIEALEKARVELTPTLKTAPYVGDVPVFK
jgi:hypothetical protein